jgi:hypothetical protein
MRTRTFEVPTDVISEFAEALAEHELTNEINGVSKDGEILIEVTYETNERESILELMELLDDHKEENEK